MILLLSLLAMLAPFEANAEDFVKSLEHLLKAPSNLLRPATTCDLTSDANVGTACSFKAICSSLPRGLQPSLYRSAEGHTLPNYRAHRLFGSINACYQRKREEAYLNSFDRQGQEKLARAKGEAERNLWKSIGGDFPGRIMSLLHERNVDLCDRREKFQPLYDSVFGEALKSGTSEQREVISAYVEANEGLRTENCRFEALYRAFEADELSSFDPELVKRLPPKLPWKGDPYLELGPVHAVEAKARLERIFEEAKAALLVKLDSFKTPENVRAIDAMKSRMDSMKMEQRFDSSCGRGPNAYLELGSDPEKAKVVVCSQLGGLPGAGLKMILMHELSHRIDPCILLLDSKPIRWKENPFRSVLSCLSGPQSIGARTLSSPDAASNAQAEIQAVCPFSGTSARPQIGEAFADWLALEALDSQVEIELLAGNRSLTRQRAAEVLVTMTFGNCEPLQLELKDQAVKWMDELQCSATEREEVRKVFERHAESETRENNPDKHPMDRDRIEGIALAKPAIAAALGCPPPKEATRCKF